MICSAPDWLHGSWNLLTSSRTNPYIVASEVAKQVAVARVEQHALVRGALI
jgi:hypothetical protein